MRTTIFRNLHRYLTDCNDSYLRSFLSVNECITQCNLYPQEFSIFMHSTDNIPAGHHPGRYHLPTAPKVALVKESTLLMELIDWQKWLSKNNTHQALEISSAIFYATLNIILPYNMCDSFPMVPRGQHLA